MPKSKPTPKAEFTSLSFNVSTTNTLLTFYKKPIPNPTINYLSNIPFPFLTLLNSKVVTTTPTLTNSLLYVNQIFLEKRYLHIPIGKDGTLQVYEVFPSTKKSSVKITRNLGSYLLKNNIHVYIIYLYILTYINIECGSIAI